MLPTKKDHKRFTNTLFPTKMFSLVAHTLFETKFGNTLDRFVVCNTLINQNLRSPNLDRVKK